MEPALLPWCGMVVLTALCLSLKSDFPWLVSFPKEWTLPLAAYVNAVTDEANLTLRRANQRLVGPNLRGGESYRPVCGSNGRVGGVDATVDAVDATFDGVDATVGVADAVGEVLDRARRRPNPASDLPGLQAVPSGSSPPYMYIVLESKLAHFSAFLRRSPRRL